MFKRLIRSPAARRRVSWLIAGILLFPFVLFFHMNLLTPVKGPGGTAGVIFGKTVGWEQFEEQLAWARRQRQGQTDQLPEAFLRLMFEGVVWDRLMLMAEARRLRLRVADWELAAFIQKIPAFRERDRFLPDRYRRYLKTSGFSSQKFEARLREDLLIEKVVAPVRASVSVTDDEVKAAYNEAHERLQTSLILVEASAFAGEASAALTDQEVRAYYDAHPDEFRVPERIRVEYAGVSREALAGRVQLNEEDVQTFYQRHQDEFLADDNTPTPLDQVKEAVRGRMIQERARAQLTALALDLEEDVDARLRFEEIAAKHALAIRSAGPLAPEDPWAPEAPEPAVLQALAKLAEGHTSAAIETDNGVSIGRVTERIAPHLAPFEEVRSTIRGRLIQERARSASRKAAEVLRAKLMELRTSGLRFEEALLTAGSVHAKPVLFTRTEPIDPIGSVPTVNGAAFRTPLGELTEALDTPQGAVIVRPEALVPADLSQFAQAADELRQKVLTQQRTARLEQWLNDLRARAKIRRFTDTPPASGS